MTRTFNCTRCNQVFKTKSEQQNHVRAECETSVRLTDLEGHIQTIIRVEDKFDCPKCTARFNRSNNLRSHWQQCKTRTTNPGNYSSFRLRTNIVVIIDKENDLDGSYHIAVCLKCEYSLPLEWIRKHFEDHHNKVRLYLLEVAYGYSLTTSNMLG